MCIYHWLSESEKNGGQCTRVLQHASIQILQECDSSIGAGNCWCHSLERTGLPHTVCSDNWDVRCLRKHAGQHFPGVHSSWRLARRLAGGPGSLKISRLWSNCCVSDKRVCWSPALLNLAEGMRPLFYVCTYRYGWQAAIKTH